ncbi:MAG: DUF3810 domain-containing protein [bacterium]|nr:DUF3810 domain-containing protein [bacterium]
MARFDHIDGFPARLAAWFGPLPDRPADRPLHTKRRMVIAVTALVLILACKVLTRFPAAVELLHARAVGAVFTRALSAVSGLVPFSLAEVIFVALCAYLIVSTVRTLTGLARKRRSARNALACFLLRTAATVSTVLALFYVEWGVSYARPAMAERMGWPSLESHSEGALAAKELARLCEELIDETNRNYRLATGSDDLGVPSGQDMPQRAWNAPIDEGYRRAVEVLDADPALAWSRGPAKPIAASWVMCWTKVVGFYFPWTGEANYNKLPPACDLIHTVAHEKAHQRCITSEDEANFMGFLACILSDDPYIRYSGYLFGQGKLMRELRSVDEEKARELHERLVPGVQRDIRACYEFWEPFETPYDHVGASINDAYLRAHGVEGGIVSYQLSSRLIVQFARANGGTCVVADTPDDQNPASQPPST